jgi:alkanesulfonate monooxygenase SsuD/methylene tetrahydromethanopterin reductase-like flavin-dependent oxidoreductase (luciferase family)
VKVGLFQTAQWPVDSDQGQRYRDLVEQCVLAEDLGYHSVWMTEHHFSRHGITSDSLAILSHLAALTSRIRLGTAVLVLPFHDPVRLAESTALVDHLSGGRLDVGIGRGYQWTEYHGFGIGFDEGSDRFEEALDVMLRSWAADEPFEFKGRFHRYDAAFPQPRPRQLPHPPLWHATTSDSGLARCAHNGWGVLIGQATLESVVAEIVGRFRGHVESAETSSPCPLAERLLVARGMFCAPTDERAEEAFRDPYAQFVAATARVAAPPGQRAAAPANPFELADGSALLETAICGSPRRCLDSLKRLDELGVGQVLLFVNLGGLQHDAVMESLRRFAGEVLPHVS